MNHMMEDYNSLSLLGQSASLTALEHEQITVCRIIIYFHYLVVDFDIFGIFRLAAKSVVEEESDL